MSTTPDANGDGTERPPNVLLLAPSVGVDEDHVCEELLHATGAGLRHALVVACAESPADRLATLFDRGTPPDRTTVVDVAMPSRSAAAVSSGDTTGSPDAPEMPDAPGASAGGLDPSTVTVDRLEDPADLVELGETIESHLNDGPVPTSLCLHSVTDLLGTSDRERVFKFLAALTSAVDRSGAVAHYHLQPDVHDPETVAVLEVLFDSVVDLRTDASTDC